jgi:S-DNA-T family DNA segregation ATPase FtsK/SpoIIIE
MIDPRARRLGFGLRHHVITPLYWLPTEVTNGLVVGEVGSGKSAFLLSLVAGLGLDSWNWEYGLIDLKMATFGPYKTGRNVRACALTGVEADEVLADAFNEMEMRFGLLAKARVQTWTEMPQGTVRPYLLVIDELAALMLPSPSEDAREARERIDRQRATLVGLALKGRAAGVFGFYGLQRPDAKVVSGSFRDQLGLRVALRSMSPDGLRMVFPEHSDELVMPNKVGRGYIQGAAGSDGSPERLNVAVAPRELVDAAFGV